MTALSTPVELQGAQAVKRPAKPEPALVNLEAIPGPLKDRAQWVCWRYEWDAERSEWTKVPHKATASGKASSTDPATWATFAAAADAYQRGGYAGIGFVLSQDDPFTAVDLDKCLGESWAVDMLDGFDSYTEVSPSGNGYRIFIEAVKPDGMGCKSKDLHANKVEVYDKGRFMTVTGHRVDGTPAEIRQRAEALATECTALLKKPRPPKASSTRQVANLPADDAELLRALERIKPQAFALYHGQVKSDDASGNDQSLCNELAWLTGSDAARMDRLFRGSALMRPKWDERHRGDGATYGQMTIETAIRDTRSAYDPNRGQLTVFDAPTFEAPQDGDPSPEPDGVDLTSPPGLAGDICRLIDLEARRPRPELYPLAALHLIAMVGGHRESIYTSKLNLITLGIASTAAGKETAQSIIKALAYDVSESQHIHGNAGSFKDLIYNLVEGDGKSLYTVDEVHSFLGAMKDKNAATYETKMEAEILTMSSTELYTFRGMEKRQLMRVYKDDEKRLQKALDDSGEQETPKLERALVRIQRRIEWLESGMPKPFFSLMGHSVPERLDSFIKPDNIDGGFLGRTLIVRCPDIRQKLRRTKGDAADIAFLKASIIENLKRVRDSGLIIAPTEEAREYIDAAVDWYDADEQLNHPVAGGIYARAPEQLYRVATILGLPHEGITLDDAKYAHALVQQSISDVKHILLKAYAESGGDDERRIKQHAREVIHRNCKRGGATESALRQRVEKPKGWQEMKRNDPTRDHFTELVEWMIANGELTLDTSGRRRRLYSAKV